MYSLLLSSQSTRLISVVAMVFSGSVAHATIVSFGTWIACFDMFIIRMKNGRPGVTCATPYVAVNSARVAQSVIRSTVARSER